MKVPRNTRMLTEPPASATGDIAFNLIVFFLVCASVQPDSGHRQEIPRSEEQEQQQEQQEKHINITLTRTTVSVNDRPVELDQLTPTLRNLLRGKPRPEDKVVVVRSAAEAPYHHWIDVTMKIEQAGGIVTIQREEEQIVQIPQ
jgi:biopolymer transport protein ExbD